MTFKSLLKRLQKRHYPSVRAFAEALGFDDPSRISRGKPFDVRGCLRLAQLTGEDPSVVLRAAGKGEIAHLIEQLYGPSKMLLPADQQTLLAAFARIPQPVERQAIITLARAAAGLTSGGTGHAGGGTEPGAFGSGLPPVGEPPQKMGDVFTRRVRSR